MHVLTYSTPHFGKNQTLLSALASAPAEIHVN